VKIGLLFHTLVVKGGSPRLFLNLARALKKGGHDVHVYTYFLKEDEYDADLLEYLNIVANVKIHDSSRFLANSFKGRIGLAQDYFTTSKKWAESIINKDFEVINPHEAIAYKTAIEMNNRQRAPITWYVADPAAYVNTVGEGRLYDNSLIYRQMLNLFSRYDKRLIQKLDKVMIPNHYLKEIMDRYYGIDTEVVRISGVDTEHFVPLNNQDEIRAELAKKFGIPVDAQLILSASILMWHRRFEDGIAAVAALNKQGGNMHYLIVGSSRSNPDYKQHLENYIKTLGAEKYVHLLDTYIADKQLLNLYNACDVFLQKGPASMRYSRMARPPL
jgi:glycosyltransferase involved in cell wall biosynthesis